MDSDRSGQKVGNIESSGHKTGGIDGKNGVVSALLIWGNHPIVISLWAILGLICAMIAPAFFVKQDHHLDMWVCFSGIFTFVLYVMGYLLRDSPIMRNRRIWVQYALGNYFASAIAIAVMAKYNNNNTPDTIVGLMLIAVAVFAFMEMAKPVYDFELLQFFLRLPLQMAVLAYRNYHVGLHILAATLLLLIGTFWHDFFMQTFTEKTSKVKDVKECQRISKKTETMD